MVLLLLRRGDACRVRAALGQQGSCTHSGRHEGVMRTPDELVRPAQHGAGKKAPCTSDEVPPTAGLAQACRAPEMNEFTG